CLVDGVGSVDAAHLLLDDVADALATAPDVEEEHQSLLRRITPDVIVRGTELTLRAATHPRELVKRTAALTAVLLRDEVKGAPDTSLNEAICSRRTIRSVVVDIDEVRAIKEALGGTINDVVLAVVS